VKKYRITYYAVVKADNEEEAYDIARGIAIDQLDTDIEEIK
jgi:hypothetical protein